MERFALYVCLAAFSTALHATQWDVGPGLTYTAPSQVSTLVGDGDTVNIAAATYQSDVCAWTANDLLLRGVGGFAELNANGASWADKAIWVIQGDRTTVEWIEFLECHVPDMNGAGIRQEGHHLTVRNCYFHLNENGILAGAISPCNITIEHSEFAYNGAGGNGFAHNLYIGHIDTLFFRYNYSHHTHDGHEIKSRAHVNFIEYNRLTNEGNGAASREIDLPDGGQAYIIGNMLHQGLQGQNSNMIGYGLESLSNPGPHELYAINNTLVNARTVGTFFSMNSNGVFFKGYNNILAGQGQFAAGGFLPLGHDTAGNVQSTIFANFAFTDINGYDYRILPGSWATGAGIPAGLSNSGYPLVAWEEYVHPTNNTTRCQHALLDAGAFEICTVGIADKEVPAELSIWPVPASDRLNIALSKGAIIRQLEVLDPLGRVIIRDRSMRGDTWHVEVGHLTPGRYTIRATTVDAVMVKGFVR